MEPLFSGPSEHLHSSLLPQHPRGSSLLLPFMLLAWPDFRSGVCAQKVSRVCLSPFPLGTLLTLRIPPRSRPCTCVGGDHKGTESTMPPKAKAPQWASCPHPRYTPCSDHTRSADLVFPRVHNPPQSHPGCSSSQFWSHL